MKKGFTLIELLAVVVILAVISLILVPVVSNVINNARIASLRSSAYGILESSKIYYAQNEIKATVRFDFDNSVVTSNDTEELITLKGDVKDGALLIDKDGKTTICITDGKSSAYKNYTEDVVSIADESCYVPSDRTVVFLSNTGATRSELTNQELTDLVAELQSEISSLRNELTQAKEELQTSINTKATQADISTQIETIATVANNAQTLASNAATQTDLSSLNTIVSGNTTSLSSLTTNFNTFKSGSFNYTNSSAGKGKVVSNYDSYILAFFNNAATSYTPVSSYVSVGGPVVGIIYMKHSDSVGGAAIVFGYTPGFAPVYYQFRNKEIVGEYYL